MIATATVLLFAACIITPAAVHVAMGRNRVDTRSAFDVRSPATSFA